MPWAVSLSLGDNNSFWTQAQHLRIISWFIWSDITLFVCQICHWIVKQKKELFFLSKTGEKRKRNFAEALKLFLNDNDYYYNYYCSFAASTSFYNPFGVV